MGLFFFFVWGFLSLKTSNFTSIGVTNFRLGASFIQMRLLFGEEVVKRIWLERLASL